MHDALSAHHAAELARLGELRRAFAATHPGAAPQGDPADERLLEAVAFLTAGVRAHLDQATAALADALLERLLPHYLRPFPATTIVEFTPNLHALRSAHRIPRGRLLRARPVDGERARFRTTVDLDLAPLEVAGATLDRSATHPRLTLHLQATEGGARALAELDRLRLYLHHPDRGVASTLLLWLRRYCTAITLRRGDGRPRGLAPAAIRDPGFDPDHRILPWPASTPPGLAVLCEHLAAPDALHFIDLVGLADPGASARDLHIDLDFAAPLDPSLPPLPHLPAAITRDLFRLHCVPAVNLFEIAAEPFRHTPLHTRHRLRADGLPAAHLEVFDVLSVSRSDRRPVVADVGPLGPPLDRYALTRQSADAGAFDTDLWLLPPAVGESADEVTISARLLATNRHLPRGLGVGDLADLEHGPVVRAYANITPVTPPLRPDRADLAQWRRLAQRLAAAAELASPEGLRDLLLLHDLGATLGGPSAGRHARRRAAIRGVERRLHHRLVPGRGPVPLPLVATRITLDEPTLPGLGDAYLLGAALDRLYASMTPLGCASELTLRLLPSEHAITWPLRSGG